MTKLVLPFIETMVTQTCNLACHGCTNYADLAHQGYLTWEEGRKQLEPWLERLDIPDFGIMGGEPLMNPYVEDWIVGLRELMPNTQIRFTTNGLLLPKRMNVVKLLEQVGNCVLKIAVHQPDSEVEETIKTIMDSYDWQPITEYGIQRYTTGDRFRFQIRRPDIFWKTYLGTYENMLPHANSPSEAFKICCQQTCPLLYKGRIYKCSTSGLLRDTLKKVGNPNIKNWTPYLMNNGIDPDCTDAELQDFVDNFGKPNRMCSMCPTAKDTQSKIIHLENVSTKKYELNSTN